MLIICVGKRSFQSQKGNQVYLLQLLTPFNRAGCEGFEAREKYVGKNIYDKVELHTAYDASIDLNGYLSDISAPVGELTVDLYE